MTKERAMTKEKSFKRRVRERMSKTGERYATARSQVVQKRDRLESARVKLADTADRPSDGKVADVTGKKWDTWFSILDRWGARERAHGETAAYLMAKHTVPGWWAQAITMWYERSRGMRLKHQQANGFTVYASKTIAVAPEVLFDAFVTPESRQGWLADGSISLRTAQPHRTARFDWDGGPTRVNASFDRKGPAKTTVAVAHERLTDPDEAELAKAAWRERLSVLKKYVEAR
jgi:hypothetical protein